MNRALDDDQEVILVGQPYDMLFMECYIVKILKLSHFLNSTRILDSRDIPPSCMLTQKN